MSKQVLLQLPGLFYATGRADTSQKITGWLKLITETAAFENMIARLNNIQAKTSQI